MATPPGILSIRSAYFFAIYQPGHVAADSVETGELPLLVVNGELPCLGPALFALLVRQAFRDADDGTSRFEYFAVIRTVFFGESFRKNIEVRFAEDILFSPPVHKAHH